MSGARGSRAPTRIVSLVPSETETVVAMAGVDRLVGRTDFCEEPVGLIEAVPTVGGTKKIDVDAVLALAPDLVLANREENGRSDVERLIAAGIDVHVSFPCTLRDVVGYLDELASILGVSSAPARELEDALRDPPSSADEGAHAGGDEGVDAGRLARVFVPIWRDPWMTFDARTYASDLLAAIGSDNVFSDRSRRFPLAADLGRAEAQPARDRDTRYPRTTREEILERAPDLVLLPDEPYAFSDADADELRAWGAGFEVARVSGKDLFWYGVRSRGALERLAATMRELRSG